MIICIDGIDGVGKSTVISLLQGVMPQHTYQDRGLPTAMTIGQTAPKADYYFILDAPWELCQERLRNAGKDMTEHWHQESSLKHFRQVFRTLAEREHWFLIDAAQPLGAVVRLIQERIPTHPDGYKEFGKAFTRLSKEELEKMINREG